MMSKSPQSHQEKEKKGFLLLNPASKTESILLSLFFLLLPTQFGKHFWPDFSIVSGIRIDYLSPIIYVTDALLMLLFGVFLLRHIRLFVISKRKSQITKLHLQPKKLFYLLSFIFLFFILNITLATRPLLSLYGFIKLLEFSFLAIYLAKIMRHQFQLQLVGFLFGVSAVFESLLAIAQYINQGSLNGIFYFFGERMFTGSTPGIANANIGGALVLRPYATFSHPNVLAGYLLIAMVLVWSFVLKSKNFSLQGIGILSLVLSSIALLLTFGRVAIFIWALFLLILLAKMINRTVRRIHKKIIICFIVIAGLVTIGSFPLFHEIFLRFAQTSLSDESVTERTELLSSSIIMIEHHQLFGVGIDNFIPALAPLQKPMPLGLYLQPVHNIFVLILCETGVIGFILFMWLLFSTIQKVKSQERKIRNTFFILLFIIAATGSFDHYWLTLQQGQLLFATIIGFSWTRIKNS